MATATEVVKSFLPHIEECRGAKIPKYIRYEMTKRLNQQTTEELIFTYNAFKQYYKNWYMKLEIMEIKMKNYIEEFGDHEFDCPIFQNLIAEESDLTYQGLFLVELYKFLEHYIVVKKKIKVYYCGGLMFLS